MLSGLLMATETGSEGPSEGDSPFYEPRFSMEVCGGVRGCSLGWG